MSLARRLVRRPCGDAGRLPGDLPRSLRRVLAARGITEPQAMDHSLKRLVPADRLLGLADALDLLQAALEQDERIVVVGDYDADGATGCAVGVRGLRAMGARHVEFLVPRRVEHGYGLSPAVVEEASAGGPGLMITVDNGIAAHAGVDAARAAGFRVLVTDHHLPGETLPAADAIVNPNQPGDDFPSKSLCGVGTLFYVLSALRTRLLEQDWFMQRGMDVPNLADLLDLVALGTAADCVELDRNNRILVGHGLARIRAGRCQPGLRALIETSGRSVESISSQDLGFVLGPRLNAAGRIADMRTGVLCLLADTPEAARPYAERLERLNQERRELTAAMQEDAEAMVARADQGLSGHAALSLYDPGWHEGIVGIVASRIKDLYQVPTVAFARSGDGAIKGSGRSVAGLHLRDVLQAVDVHEPGLLLRYGGHAMAAGLTLQEAELPRFKQAFESEVQRHRQDIGDPFELLTDGELDAADFTVGTATLMRDYLPWGQGFPVPLFEGEFDVVSSRPVGDNRHLAMRLRVPGREKPLKAIYFNVDPGAWPRACRRAQCGFELDVDDYGGVEQPQLILRSLRPLDEA